MEVTSLHQVTPEEAKTHLEELIKSALEGETVIITQDAEHQVQLVLTPAIHTIVSLGAARAHLP